MTTQVPASLTTRSPSRRSRFLALRTKFVVFFSLILILACSMLTWFFIENRRAAMAETLEQLGTILLTNIVNNPHFRYAGLVAEDRATLNEFIDGLMAVPDVVYVVVTKSDGSILMQRSKGLRHSSDSLQRSESLPLYPDHKLASRVLEVPSHEPRMTQISIVRNVSARFAWEDHLYDFAMPVLRSSEATTTLESLSLELEETRMPSLPPIHGVVQIGLTDAHLKRTLIDTIRNVLIITIFIIGAGIVGALLLVKRITNPLHKLTGVAQQVAEGVSPDPLVPSTKDEVGQLTNVFNYMTRSLEERNAAITKNMETIRRQITQLTTVHQASSAITRTLDLNALLDTVLDLLMSNLGFSHMVLMLRHEDTELAYVARVAGVAPEIVEAAQQLTLPIEDNNTLMADLFIHDKPVLVSNIEDVAHRMHPAILALARRVGVTSFVLVPLISHNRTLGFIGGDRGAQGASEEDLNILKTIASHVATAIDNARAYADLERLAQEQEFRIQQRTQELSAANERLQEHDHRRSLFFSVASHELRTPMTAIRSFADNMLDGVAGPLTERQTAYLTRIGHNLNRLTRIINQLLDWSRLDLQKETLRLEQLCLGQIVGLVAESLRTVATDKGVTITTNIPEGLPGIQGDRDKLEQIFWNLIGNAVKFTPQGGSITVELSATDGSRVAAKVHDTGCGIAPQHLNKIFDEFSKVPSALPSSQGAQLGLFISRSLISMHGGTIGVESVVAKGTTFTVTFPSMMGIDEKDSVAESPGSSPVSGATA